MGERFTVYCIGIGAIKYQGVTILSVYGVIIVAVKYQGWSRFSAVEQSNINFEEDYQLTVYGKCSQIGVIGWSNCIFGALR